MRREGVGEAAGLPHGHVLEVVFAPAQLGFEAEPVGEPVAEHGMRGDAVVDRRRGVERRRMLRGPVALDAGIPDQRETDAQTGIEAFVGRHGAGLRQSDDRSCGQRQKSLRHGVLPSEPVPTANIAEAGRRSKPGGVLPAAPGQA